MGWPKSLWPFGPLPIFWHQITRRRTKQRPTHWTWSPVWGVSTAWFLTLGFQLLHVVLLSARCVSNWPIHWDVAHHSRHTGSSSQKDPNADSSLRLRSKWTFELAQDSLQHPFCKVLTLFLIDDRQEEQAARVLPVLAEEQDPAQWPRGGEEAGLDHRRRLGGLRSL